MNLSYKLIAILIIRFMGITVFSSVIKIIENNK